MMKKRRIDRSVTVLAAMMVVGAGWVQGADKAAPVKAVKVGSVTPIHVCGDIYLAGQPSPEDLQAMRRLGVKSVITLRPRWELDWDEAAEVKKLGMKYYQVPFRAPETLTDEVFDRVRQLLGGQAPRPLLLHCRSAGRVGAVWIPFRVLDQKVALETALAEAEKVGLHQPLYVERAKAYIARKEGAK